MSLLIGDHGPNTDPGWVRRVFPNGQPYSDVTQLGGQVSAAITPVLAAGDWPFFSFKPPINGTTAQWQAAADALIATVDPLLGQYPNAKVFATPWHEPENDMSGAAHVKIFNWFYSYVKNHTLYPARFLWGPVNMAYQWQTGRAVANVADWIPTNFDFRGVDAYTHASLPAGSLRNHAGYQRWLSSVAATSSVFLVERGVSGVNNGPGLSDSDQLAVITEDITDLRAIGAYGYLYWNVDTSYTYHLGTQSTAYLTSVAAQEQAPPPPPPPPATYTQEQLDAAVAAATQAGITQGIAEGNSAGQAAAYNDVLAYINTKLAALDGGQ